MTKPPRAIPAWMKCEKIPFVVLAMLCPLLQIRAAEVANSNGHILPAGPGGPRHADLYGEEIDKTLTTQFTDGWFAEENSPTGPFRWMSAEGHIDVTTRRKGTLVIRVHTRSFVTDNSLELLADGKSIQSVKLSGVEWQDCLVRVPLSAGTHHLSFRSHQSGGQPPGDNRTLTICVENFQATLEP